MRQDYTEAPYFAISSLGYGKGWTAAEAVENYVKIQMRNYPAKTTVFGTGAKWRDALTNGEAKATVFKAPEGFTGFVIGMGSQWTRTVDGKTEYRDFAVEDHVEVKA